MAENKRVGVFFDGTGNHNENDKGIDHSNSNVGRLFDQYDDSNGAKFYEKGVGTVDLTKDEIKKVKDGKGKDGWGNDHRDDYYSETAMALGHGMDTRVDNNLEKVKDFLADNPDSELTIDVFGFSRGAAEARFFVNKANAYINEQKLQDKVHIGFVGIFDTVESDNEIQHWGNGGQGNINLNKDSADKIVHFTASDEKRDTFDLTTLKDKDGKLASNMEEIEMIGVHSDVGGGYEFTKKGEGQDCDADEEQCYRAEPTVGKCLTAPYLGGDNAILQRSLELDSFAKEHHYNILKKTRTFYMNSQVPALSYTEVCAKMEHRVYDGLNNVHLNLMADKARAFGVPLKEFGIDNKDYTYGIHDDTLSKYYRFLKNKGKVVSKDELEKKLQKGEKLTENEKMMLQIENKYVNDSLIGLMNYDNDSGIFDADGKARDVIDNKPNKAVIPNKVKKQKDYGQDNHVTLPSQNKYDYTPFNKDIYIVKEGDYLGKIANLYHMTVDEILNLNPQIIDKNKISIGQKININKNKKLSQNFISQKNSIVSKNQKTEEVPSSNTWDKHTNRRIQKIHPLIRNSAKNFINDVQKKLNIKLRVTTGMRTITEQDELYKQGRTKKGKKVTWVTGGYSYHNYGLAIDVVEIKNNQAIWNTKWQDISKIGKDKGFEWGGDWKGALDRPHFQKTFGYKTKQLKKMLLEGKVKNGFVDISGGSNITSTTDKKPEKVAISDNNTNVYRVKRGDFLSKIAKKYNLSLDELLNLNPQITNKNKILIGQKIYTSKTVPKKKTDSSNVININLENKSQKLFKKLGLRHEKIPTLKHNQNLPEKVEGMYRKDDLSLKKNPRVSDKKAEAVAMHEIYHHIQKDKGLELESEESTANMIEKAYLNENQETSQEPDFDLIYAYTIKQFYEHEELEQLVHILGGDRFSAKRVYSNAMYVIASSNSLKIE